MTERKYPGIEAAQSATETPIPEPKSGIVEAPPAANDTQPTPSASLPTAQGGKPLYNTKHYRKAALEVIASVATGRRKNNQLVQREDLDAINAEIETLIYGTIIVDGGKRTMPEFNPNQANYSRALPLMEQALALGEVRWYKEMMTALLDRQNFRTMIRAMEMVIAQDLTDGRDEVQFILENRKRVPFQKALKAMIEEKPSAPLLYLSALILNTFESSQKFRQAVPAMEKTIEMYEPENTATFRPPLEPGCKVLMREKETTLKGENPRNQIVVKVLCEKILEDETISDEEKRQAHTLLSEIYKSEGEQGKHQHHLTQSLQQVGIVTQPSNQSSPQRISKGEIVPFPTNNLTQQLLAMALGAKPSTEAN